MLGGRSVGVAWTGPASRMDANRGRRVQRVDFMTRLRTYVVICSRETQSSSSLDLSMARGVICAQLVLHPTHMPWESEGKDPSKAIGPWPKDGFRPCAKGTTPSKNRRIRAAIAASEHAATLPWQYRSHRVCSPRRLTQRGHAKCHHPLASTPLERRYRLETPPIPPRAKGTTPSQNRLMRSTIAAVAPNLEYFVR